MASLPILQGHKLTKSFYSPAQVDVLKGIDLTVMPGETVAIMGRSGEGKTTLLHTLGTLEKPCQGELRIANQMVTGHNLPLLRNRHLAFIFQSFYLLEDLTALQNVLLPARIARKSTRAGSPAYQRACLLLDQVGMAPRMHFHTKLLSGGEKQRVALARALCNDPDVVLADEPSGNLDTHTAQIIHQLLLDFVREGNKALIVVTHDRDLARLCQTHYQLIEGRLTPLCTG